MRGWKTNAASVARAHTLRDAPLPTWPTKQLNKCSLVLKGTTSSMDYVSIIVDLATSEMTSLDGEYDAHETETIVPVSRIIVLSHAFQVFIRTEDAKHFFLLHQ